MGSNGCGNWFKSSFSADDKDCVEVWFAAGAAHVRSSNDRQGAVLVFNRGEWESFLLGAFNGEFEMPI
ncbi:hypothetical protein ABH935_000488 [Catenulispora sp. GAS73]|uniref:DUF397 domain-containing protein n=1 Tax=Catenulispora sp. GAS73 TaxID=3156269 RepID=UPI0035129E40